LYKINVWFYSFCLKLVPCTLLSIITCLLIRALIQVNQVAGDIPLIKTFISVLKQEYFKQWGGE
jgi:hypothetical protein